MPRVVRPSVTDELQQVRSFDPSETFDDDYLWFYDPLFAARTDDDVAEIIETLDLAPGSTILDAPCGAGRIANELARAGFAVSGVDLSAAYIARAVADAERLGVSVDYSVGDLLDLPHRGPFDAVVCWFTSFGYFDDVGNRRTLDEFAAVLRPGGTLLIETMHHDGFVRRFTPSPAATINQRGDDSLIDVTTFDPISGRIERERTVHRNGETRRAQCSIRVPTVPELKGWLAAAGFVSPRFTDRRGLPLTFDSWRLIATAVRG